MGGSSGGAICTSLCGRRCELSEKNHRDCFLPGNKKMGTSFCELQFAILTQVVGFWVITVWEVGLWVICRAGPDWAAAGRCGPG